MRFALPALFAITALIGTPLMIMHGDKIERENNAFAKDCNDRGGVAYFGIDSRQCIGAQFLPRRPNV
jgi:hypothetical protein